MKCSLSNLEFYQILQTKGVHHLKISKFAFNNLIEIERNAQDEKWGEQKHSDEKWLAILLEELGEAAKSVLEKNNAELLEEVVQVGAVLQNWVTSRDWYDTSSTFLDPGKTDKPLRGDEVDLKKG